MDRVFISSLYYVKSCASRTRRWVYHIRYSPVARVCLYVYEPAPSLNLDHAQALDLGLCTWNLQSGIHPVSFLSHTHVYGT